MPYNPPRPKSSIPKKSTRSSLHPHGAPTFSETVEGLKKGLANLGTHLVGAGAGMAGNLIGGLTNLKQSARNKEEGAEEAYSDALELLRNSGSSFADSLLKELGEESEEDDEQNRKSPH